MKIFRKYFEVKVGAEDGNLGINILDIGHNIHPANLPYPDPSHPDNYYFDWEKGRSLTEYQIVYISKGEGFFEANGQKPQLIESGTIILIYPGIWHRYRPKESTGWEEYWIGFTGNYAHYLLDQECFSPRNPIIKVGFNNEFIVTFSKLIDVIERNDENLKKLSSFLVIQILGTVYASVLLLNKKRTKKDELIYEIVDNIHENWNRKIDFEKLAKSYNLSYIWFRKSFKNVLNTSPNQYQLTLKIRKAIEMIQETNLTIGEIAFQSGFESEFYFSRIFKQKMNFNASELRKKGKVIF